MADDKAPQPKPALPILPLLNTLTLLGALGMMVYTKILYKNPQFTEASERTKLEKLHATPKPPPKPALIHFDSITVTLAALTNTKGSEHSKSKNHYATLSFSIEIRDGEQKDIINDTKALILDQMISKIGKKRIQDLTTNQGRYTLQAELTESINRELGTLDPKLKDEEVVTRIYFENFIVQ